MDGDSLRLIELINPPNEDRKVRPHNRAHYRADQGIKKRQDHIVLRNKRINQAINKTRNKYKD